MSVCEAVKHYQRSIDKCNGDEDRILHCLSKLYRLPVTVQHLQDTGIGRTVNALRRFDGQVASASKSLVAKWKAMVEEDSDEQEEPQPEHDGEGEVQEAEGMQEEVEVESVEEKRRHVVDAHEGTGQKEQTKKNHHEQNHHRSKEVSNASHTNDTRKPDMENGKSSHRSHKRHRSDDTELEKSNKKHKHEVSESSKKNNTSSSGSDDRESQKNHHRHKSSSSSSSRKEKSSVESEESHGKNLTVEHTKQKEESNEKHSSKSKHKSKSSDKHKKDDRKSRSSKEHKDKRKTDDYDEGIGSHSGPSFEEALGFASTKSPKKKSSSSHTLASTSKVGTSPALLETPKLLSPTLQLAPLNLDLSTIPTASPNYRPLPYIEDNRQPKMTMQNAVGLAISSKNQRTKVYSGNKGSLTHVPTLYEMCIRLLQENIDAVEYTGGVPYDILRPVLERATPDQLFVLEHHNPYLIEESDPLWEFHCNKRFRGKPRMEMEGWREMFLRCQDEQEAKLRSITANIKQSQDKSQPVRKAKMAFFDSVVKPPRNIAKKQAQFGTARMPVVTPAARVSALSGLNSNIARAGDTRCRVRTGAPDHAQVTSSHKPKRAPLMTKALSLMKGRYKR